MVRIFGHYIPKGLVFLLLIEFIELFLCVHLATEIRLSENVSPELYHDFNIKASSFAAIFLLVMVAVGLYQRSTRETFGQIIARLFWGSLMAFWALSLVFYLFPEIFIGRGVFIISVILAFFVIGFNRYLFNLIAEREFFQSRLLVIGTGARASQLMRLRRKSDWRGIKLVGFLHLKGDKDEIDEEDLIIRSDDSLMEIVAQFGINEIIVAVEDTRKNYPVEEVIRLKLSGMKITHVTSFFERRTGSMEIDTLTPNQVIFFEGFDSNTFKEVIKRMFDVTVSLIFLLLSLPVQIVLWLAIKSESRWRDPVIYSQTRVGQQGKPFTIYKYRSMVVDAEKDGPQYASQNDSRITKTGGFIRKSRLDELPQLWNVLKGDMSFVGPRPERPNFVEDLKHEVAFYDLRHRVKPGITGWAQICYPYGDTVDDAKQKLKYDLYYIKNFSLFLDLTILMQTFQVIVWQKGSR